MTNRLPAVHVLGHAERRVVPDRVAVWITIQTATLPTPAAALALGVERRARVRDALAAGAPEATVSDARVTTVPQYQHVEEPDAHGRVTSRSELRGYQGVCRLVADADAGAAAGLMALAGTHPDVSAASPSFTIGPALRRATERELEQEAVRDAIKRARGLAVAAGKRLGEVLAVGEPPAPRPDGRDDVMAVYSMKADMGAEMEDALGELVPEAQTLSASVPVSLALLPDD